MVMSSNNNQEKTIGTKNSTIIFVSNICVCEKKFPKVSQSTFHNYWHVKGDVITFFFLRFQSVPQAKTDGFALLVCLKKVEIMRLSILCIPVVVVVTPEGSLIEGRRGATPTS